jgi:hypothetical protein
VEENVSSTGAGVGHGGAMLSILMWRPDTRQPPWEPVSPELHAAVAAARHSTAAPVRNNRITF